MLIEKCGGGEGERLRGRVGEREGERDKESKFVFVSKFHQVNAQCIYSEACGSIKPSMDDTFPGLVFNPIALRAVFYSKMFLGGGGGDGDALQQNAKKDAKNFS